MASIHRRAFLTGAVSTAAALGLGAANSRLLAAESVTPESHGVASGAVRNFLRAIAGSAHELHSLVIRRHADTIAQGWSWPYRAEAVHSLYSLSKSFTSTAVGFATAEGRFQLDDRVIDFFPQQRPANPSEHLAALRVRDLLTMSVGQSTDSVAHITREDDWVRAFLTLPIDHVPGSVFLYNSGATYMLSAIIERVSGQKLIEYLRPRLLDPLGIRDARWAVCPHGINTGGWGLSVSTPSIAKSGQFYLQQGQWQRRQLLSKQWVTEATSFKIQQPPGAGGTRPDADLAQLKQTSDWHQGYGYQFWRCRHDAFRADGAFGQFCIVLPRQDAVIAITSLTTDSQGLLNLVWEHLLPGMHDGPLPDDPSASAHLSSELTALSLPLPSGARHSETAPRVSNKRFDIDANTLGARNVSLRFEEGACLFELHTDTRHGVRCGLGKWLDGITTMPGTPPEFTELAGKTSPEPLPVKVSAVGAWKDQNTFVMHWRFYETPHYDTVTCRFDRDRVQVEFANNITTLSHGAHVEVRPVLEGRLAT
jgi:CubicO group peptidase (beta-lactamase class C family)